MEGNSSDKVETNSGMYYIAVSRVDEVKLEVRCTVGIVLARAAIDMDTFSSTSVVLIP
jgi:hypothetical protein